MAKPPPAANIPTAFRAGLGGFSVQVMHQLADDRLVMTYKIFSGRHIVEHWGVVDLPSLQGQLAASS